MADKLKSLVLKWWPVFMWTLIALATGLSLAFVKTEQREIACIKLIINHLDERNAFIDNGDILQMLSMKNLNPVGKPLNEINTALLENIINANPYVANTEVFSTIDGKIKIEVKQRRPVVRIVNVKDESFYIDDKGEFMPLSGEYTARVAVANGFIFDTESERRVTVYDGEKKDTAIKLSRIDEIFHVADYIYHHEFWNAQIEQIYVNAEGDIELIPRVGSQNIVLGNSEKLEKKLNKLLLFYREGLNKTGWNKYKTINLKYEGQVVCTKK